MKSSTSQKYPAASCAEYQSCYALMQAMPKILEPRPMNFGQGATCTCWNGAAILRTNLIRTRYVWCRNFAH